MVIFSVVPLTEPCSLRSTEPLKVSTRDFSWGKGGQCVWLTTYHPYSAETSRKSRALTYPEPLGPHRPVVGDLCFYLFRTVLTDFCLIAKWQNSSGCKDWLVAVTGPETEKWCSLVECISHIIIIIRRRRRISWIIFKIDILGNCNRLPTTSNSAPRNGKKSHG